MSTRALAFLIMACAVLIPWAVLGAAGLVAAYRYRRETWPEVEQAESVDDVPLREWLRGYIVAAREDAVNEARPPINWDAFDHHIARANSASPIYDALSAERLSADLADDDAIARWLRP